MKKALFTTLAILILLFGAVYAFLYYVPYSEGVRSGELIKFSHKGFIIKTWEGEISQGISGAQIFPFSVLDRDQEVIDRLVEFQGDYVKLYYKEHFTTFPWWGDTNYFIYRVEPDQSPHVRQ